MAEEKLTARELRLIALMLEGFSAEEAEVRLGIPRELVLESTQSIRTKIKALDDEDVEDAVQRRLSNALVDIAREEELAPSVEVSERREKLLLRLTIKDLLRVAADAELRAAMLEATVDNIGSVSEADARREIEDLRDSGLMIRQTAEGLLQKIRHKSS